MPILSVIIGVHLTRARDWLSIFGSILFILVDPSLDRLKSTFNLSYSPIDLDKKRCVLRILVLSFETPPPESGNHIGRYVLGAKTPKEHNFGNCPSK